MGRSDQGSAFCADIFKAFARLLGFSTWDFSAPDDPLHHSLLERRHQVIDAFIDQGMMQGDIKDQTTMALYLASAQAKCNLEYEYEGHTVSEYITGQRLQSRKEAVKVSAPWVEDAAAMKSSTLATIKVLKKESTILTAPSPHRR